MIKVKKFYFEKFNSSNVRYALFWVLKLIYFFKKSVIFNNKENKPEYEYGSICKFWLSFRFEVEP